MIGLRDIVKPLSGLVELIDSDEYTDSLPPLTDSYSSPVRVIHIKMPADSRKTSYKIVQRGVVDDSYYDDRGPNYSVIFRTTEDRGRNLPERLFSIDGKKAYDTYKKGDEVTIKYRLDSVVKGANGSTIRLVDGNTKLIDVKRMDQ